MGILLKMLETSVRQGGKQSKTIRNDYWQKIKPAPVVRKKCHISFLQLLYCWTFKIMNFAFPFHFSMQPLDTVRLPEHLQHEPLEALVWKNVRGSDGRCVLEGPQMRFLCRDLASDCLQIESLYWSACVSVWSFSEHLASPHPIQRGVRFLPAICPAAPHPTGLHFMVTVASRTSRVRRGLLETYAHFSLTA